MIPFTVKEENGLYHCDPSRAKDCPKTHCYIYGGECRLTTNINYAIQNPTVIIPKHDDG